MITKNQPELKALTTISSTYSACYLNGDCKSLEKILDPDWTLITAGCVEEVYKMNHIGDLESGKLKVNSIKDSDVRVRIFNDSAVVTGMRESNATYDGRDVSDMTRFSQFYIKRQDDCKHQDNWMCVSTHISSVPIDQNPSARLVRVLSEKNRNCYLNADCEGLSSILADDWILITAGCVDEVYKKNHLEDLRSGKLKVNSIRDSDIRVRVFGDSVVVTGKRQSDVAYNNRDVSDVTQFSQFYVNSKDGWKCVSTHVNSISNC